MLRIDENAKTLVAPQGGFVPAEVQLDRADLLQLLSSGWEAFVQELGEPTLQLVAVEPMAEIDMLAFDVAAGRCVVVKVGGELTGDHLGRAITAAGVVASWDAATLSGVHEVLSAAAPHDSPRVVMIGAEFDPAMMATVEWLVRRHGLEVTVHQLQFLRFGNEKLMNVVRAYPPSEAPADPASGFVAELAASSAPPGA